MDYKIPDRVLNDIILVFLVGVKTKFVDSEGNRINDLVLDTESPIYTTWKDIFSLREAIVRFMGRSDKKKIYKLAKTLKKVWKL